jgi:hypothetical protein
VAAAAIVYEKADIQKTIPALFFFMGLYMTFVSGKRCLIRVSEEGKIF